MQAPTLPMFSTTKAMQAISDLPQTFVRDIPSVGVYTLISWLSSALHDQMSKMGQNSPLMFHLINGVIDTGKQDYLLNLNGLAPSNP